MSENPNAVPQETTVPQETATQETPVPAPETSTSSVPAEIVAKLAEFGQPDELAEKLHEEFGAETVEHLLMLTAEDLAKVGVKILPARQLVESLRKSAVAAKKDSETIGNTTSGLAKVPGYNDISGALRTNGVLVMKPLAVAYATQASIVPSNTFKAPRKLDEIIEKNLRKQGKKAPAGYLRTVRKGLLKSAYAEILSLIEGPPADYITDTRRDTLIADVREQLLPALYKFYGQLKEWKKEFKEDITDNLLLAVVARDSGGSLADMADEPSTRMLHASLEEMVDTVNKVLAYDGEEVATAIGAEVVRITEILTDESYWPLAGVIDLDGLKAKLDIKADSVSSLTEYNLTQFAYNCMLMNQNRSIDKVTINNLIRCGNEIDWNAIIGYSEN